MIYAFALIGLITTAILLVSYLTDVWHRVARRRHQPRLVMVHPTIPRAVAHHVRQRIPTVETTGEWQEMARRLS